MNDRTEHFDPSPYLSERARGGDIILRKGWERVVFIAGLARRRIGVDPVPCALADKRENGAVPTYTGGR